MACRSSARSRRAPCRWNAVGGGPGRLIRRPDQGRTAARLLVAPDEFQPRLRVVGIEHARFDLLAFYAVDLLVDDILAAERLHQIGVTGIATERSFALDYARRGGGLGRCGRRGEREHSCHQAHACGSRLYRTGHRFVLPRDESKMRSKRYCLSAALTSFTASSLAHSAGPATVPSSHPAGSTSSVVGIPAARPTIFKSWNT